MAYITVTTTDGETTSWDNAEVLGIHEGNFWLSAKVGEIKSEGELQEMQNYGIPVGEVVNLMVEPENGHDGHLTLEDSTLYNSLEASGVIE